MSDRAEPSGSIRLPKDLDPAGEPVSAAGHASEVAAVGERTTVSDLAWPSPGRLGQYLLVGLALLVIGWMLWRARSSMTPFVVGLFLAYLLMPMVDRLARGMRRPLAILLVYINALIILFLGTIFIVPPVIDQTRRLIEAIPSVETVQSTSNWFLEEYQRRVPDELREPIDTAAASALRSAQANISAYASAVGAFFVNQTLRLVGTLTFLIGFLIIPFWLFYILNDKEAGQRLINRLLNPRFRPDFWNSWSMINKTFSSYIRGQLVLGLAVGLAVAVGLFALRLLGFEVRYILLLAIIAGITELIPIIGPLIGAIPAVLLAAFTTDNPVATVLAVSAVYIVVQQLENNFLVPRIVGDSVGIHPAILTVVLIAMGDIFGLLGIILSAPIAAMARDLFTYAYKRFGGASASEARAIVLVEKNEATA